jgi:hypothetical protein
VIAPLLTGADGGAELWKINHYYERLDDWNADHGITLDAFASPAAEPAWELHNLSSDPEERQNRTDGDADAFSQMRSVLETQHEEKRLLPTFLRNP